MYVVLIMASSPHQRCLITHALHAHVFFSPQWLPACSLMVQLQNCKEGLQKLNQTLYFDHRFLCRRTFYSPWQNVCREKKQKKTTWGSDVSSKAILLCLALIFSICSKKVCKMWMQWWFVSTGYKWLASLCLCEDDKQLWES